MPRNIDKTIEKVRQFYSNDINESKFIDEQERKLRRLIKQAELSEHPLIQAVIAMAQKEIAQIDLLLLHDDSLDTNNEKRRALKHQKQVHQFYIQRLGGAIAKRQIESIKRRIEDAEERVDSYVKNYKV